MRLTNEQLKLILDTVCQVAGSDTMVYLFGSRVDDRARGGDVDLLLESVRPLSLMNRAQIQIGLESLLGLPVDLVCKIKDQPANAFQTIAQRHAVKLSP